MISLKKGLFDALEQFHQNLKNFFPLILSENVQNKKLSFYDWDFLCYFQLLSYFYIEIMVHKKIYWILRPDDGIQYQ